MKLSPYLILTSEAEVRAFISHPETRSETGSYHLGALGLANPLSDPSLFVGVWYLAVGVHILNERGQSFWWGDEKAFLRFGRLDTIRLKTNSFAHYLSSIRRARLHNDTVMFAPATQQSV